jgi:hypothetical protein|tara:strand:+ start:375 stop:647 length:273 start_codon:yes stop_codon:yes gene_type:complete
MDEFKNETEELEHEAHLIEQSMDNAYLILTKRRTIDQLIDERGDETGIWLPSKQEDQKDVIDVVLDHYIEREEYEKCAELVEAKKKESKI